MQSVNVGDTVGLLFLFAVLRDVQRNFGQRVADPATGEAFLFAVLRDVQRNGGAVLDADVMCRVSIRCLARRTAEPWRTGRVVIRSEFLFAVLRDVQRNDGRGGNANMTGDSFYSLSCETYSGTDVVIGDTHTTMFLFAVLRDVQRNITS